MSKRCSVACDTPEGVLLCELELADEATIEVALQAARSRWGEAVTDWARAPVGIHGELRSRSERPADGERIEIYRALAADPRAARRARLRAQRSRTRGGR